MSGLTEARPHVAAARRSLRRIAWAAAGVAAAAVLFFALQTGQPPTPPAPTPPARDADDDTALLDDGEPLQVASADEIEILSVTGADAQMLAVHDLPPRGPLELLRPGEVSLVQPMRDNMVQVRLEGPSSPMIWARLDSEMEDE